jgi:hypothetical protein
MVSTTSFIQANLQHSIAASRVLARTVIGKGIDIALIQEPWYHKNCIRGLNIPGYTLYSAGGTDRPRSCILVGGMTSWLLTGFSSRDLVAVLVKYLENEMERWAVICSAYLPYDSEDPPPTKEMEELISYYDGEHPHLMIGCDSTHIIWRGVAPIVMVQGKPWWNSLVLLTWRFLTRATNPPFVMVRGQR